MICNRCGNPVPDDVTVCPNCGNTVGKTCKYCGSAVEIGAAVCPFCGEAFDAEPVQAPAPAQQPVQQPAPQPVPAAPQPVQPQPNGKPKKKGKVLNKIILILSLLFVLVTAALVLLIHFDVIDSPFRKTGSSKKNETSQSASVETTTAAENGEAGETTSVPEIHPAEDFKVDSIDADDYYNKNATGVQKTKASDSKTVQSGAEAYKDLTSRGFNQYDILTSFTLDGELEEVAVDGNTTESYPMYQTYYTTEDDETWQIISVNGNVYAYPLTYYLDENPYEVPFVLSENDTVTGFDNVSKTFYESVPNDSVMKIKKVKKINAKTLENIDQSSIEYYEEGDEENE